MLSKTHTKYIQSLQHKKFRDETGLFIAEGPKVVTELLASGRFICKELLALENWLNAHQSILAAMSETNVHLLADFELQKISSLKTANEVMAIFEKRKPDFDFSPKASITMALDAVQDPGNLGTIIRICDWFGIANLVCAPGTADMYNPKVVQSTMGSLGRVNVVYTDLPVWLKNNVDVPKFSASLIGKDVKQLGVIKEGVFIVGNESNGVSDEVLALVDEKITIRKTGEAESLNAAVAAGIILSQITG